ncbi:MAG: response regulator [Phycisphaerales bacterium]|nr:response regulator [Phycisphaerales bacterium]
MDTAEIDTAQEPLSLSIVTLDDDADFREYVTGFLSDAGHEVRAVATPADLYATCEERLPEVVLLDLNMGRHRGEDVLAEIRKRWEKLCVVVLTGHPTMDSMRETFKRHVFDYVAKPFEPAELERVLSQAAAEFSLGVRPQDRLRAALGRQIRLARSAKGWTLKDLSEDSGVSVSQLSSIERGAHLPSLESLLMIALSLEAQPSAWLAAAEF